MSRKIIFFNVTWMSYYRGHEDIIPESGGQYVKNNNYGHEMYNFQEYAGKIYGYFRLGKWNEKNPKGLRIKRLGAHATDSDISGVDVIWVAHKPKSTATYIVGWYRNATVFKKRQKDGPVERNYNGDKFDYFTITKSTDAVLVPVDERNTEIPRGKNGMGQCQAWYADAPENQEFVVYIENYINNFNKWNL